MLKPINKNLLKENQEVIEYLRKSHLFGHLPEEMLKQLVPLSEITHFPKEAIILKEGQPNEKVYFLIRGHVTVSAENETILILRRIGDIFGEMSVISDKPCAATITALTNITLFSIHSREIGQYTDVDPEMVQSLLYRIFAKILTEKLSLTTNKAKKYEEAHRLSGSLTSMVEKYEKELNERKELEKKLVNLNHQLHHELELGAEFQKRLLPKDSNCSFIKMGSKYLPFEQVSGDVYEISDNREGDFNLFLGDATGHGVAAALMTMMVHIGLDNIRHDLSASEIIDQLNMLLVSKETGKSLTGTYLRIKENGLLTACQAGHPSLIIIPNDGSKRVLLKKEGMPLGMSSQENIPYQEESYQLKKGDKVFLYTDGVIEWENPNNRQFGFGKFIKFLEKNIKSDVDTILDDLICHLEKFSDGSPCLDDLTILALEYLGK